MPRKPLNFLPFLVAPLLFGLLLVWTLNPWAPSPTATGPLPEETDPGLRKIWKTPREIGRLGAPELGECSGLTRSGRARNLIWTHDDSGSEPRLFALEVSGKVRSRVSLGKVQPRDFEDIALGPAHAAPEGQTWKGNETATHLYVADTGDNSRTRTSLTIYRLPEPDLEKLGPAGTVSAKKIQRLDFRYPDLSFDCEALVVHPTSGRLFLLTKMPFRATVFTLENPEKPEGVQVARRVMALTFPDLVTAADFSPSGECLAVRGYFRVEEYRLLDPTVGLEVEGLERIAAFPHREPQGEAIGYLDENSLLTISEGQGARIYRIDRVSGGEK